MSTNVGAKLRALRLERGMTGVFVARKLGLSKAMISAIELNRCNPTLPQFIDFVNFYNVSADYLIKDDI